MTTLFKDDDGEDEKNPAGEESGTYDKDDDLGLDRVGDDKPAEEKTI